jgi:ABC-type transport system involved in multi-copper enzyme maturation permease subunit
MSARAPAASAAQPPAHDRPGDGDAFARIAMRMCTADFLKLRKRRSVLIWALVLALGPVIVFLAVKAIQHSSNPTKYGPAGGAQGFRDGLRVLALFFGPLAAILIGVEAGTGDASAGVFRDLVVTGRSRVALFASRVPAALALCWTVTLAAYVLLLAGVYLLAGNLPTPGGALVLNGLGFMLLATGVVCVLAVGFASLTTSKPASVTALIGWQLVASPLIAQIGSLGSAREALFSQAIAHFSPVRTGNHGGTVMLSQGTALVVLIAWLAVFLLLGAWRTRTMDA